MASGPPPFTQGAGPREIKIVNGNIHHLDEISCDKDVVKVNLSGNTLADATGLKKCKKLQWCNLSKNLLKSMQFVINVKQMRVLNLGHNQIEDISPVAALTGLQALILNNNLIKSLVGLEGLTQLNTLILSHNLLQHVDVSFLGLLKKLQLAHNQITEFPNIKFMPELTSVSLNDNQIERVPQDCIGVTERLKIVDLGKNRIRKLKCLKELERLEGMTSLNLNGNPLCDRATYKAKALGMFPSLKLLDARSVATIKVETTEPMQNIDEKSANRLASDGSAKKEVAKRKARPEEDDSEAAKASSLERPPLSEKESSGDELGPQTAVRGKTLTARKTGKKVKRKAAAEEERARSGVVAVKKVKRIGKGAPLGAAGSLTGTLDIGLGMDSSW